MQHRRLVLVVCDRLRKSIGPTAGLVSLGRVTLLVHRGEERFDRFNPSEKQWEDGLSSELITVLQNDKSAAVRVAVHQTTCFANQLQKYSAPSFQPPIQARYVKEESELKAATGIHDLQVWGFSRIDGMAPMWDALRSIVTVFNSSIPAESTRFELGQALDETFIDALARDPYELWTNCQHHIMGLFAATRMNLEVAAERAGTDQAEARVIVQEALRGLEDKVSDARRTLDNTKRILEEQSKDRLDMCKETCADEAAVIEVLRALPELGDLRTATCEFNEWLARLDESLQRVREGLK